VVGASGSGKSTLGRLIVGLERPWEGEVRRVRDVAYVDQEITLLQGTLRDNLTLYDASVSDERLVQACEDALLMDVIRALPGGLDGQLLEGGVNLSGGERQRLEIARALAQQPALLVLDEATSALDGETERRVMDNLARRGCAVVLIAHRLGPVRHCDEIVVLEGGRVVERGSHEGLMASVQGRYRELVLREEGR
jgi:ATP-binding cassette subfamily C protein